jgi:hypothetical protein
VIDVFALPGTGSPTGGDGITEECLRFLDPRKFRTHIVDYPAEGFGFGQAFETSRSAGMAALDRATAGVEHFAVLGYSQGAVAAGDWAERYIDAAQNGPAIDHAALDRLRGVILIADGRRPADRNTPGHTAPGYGIMGQRYLTEAFCPVLYAAAPGDPICALPAGNPLRSVADTIGWLSIRNPAEALLWGTKVLDTIRRRQLQPWWTWEFRRDWGGAADFARGFLFDGRHTLDYIRYGHCHDVAMKANQVIRAA